jgi:DNA modification methylase
MLEINKIYCMDNIEGMRLLDNSCIDLTVTSPPYDNLRDYNGYTWDFENIAKELYRITKVGGVVVWVVGDKIQDRSESGSSFRQALYFKEIGFNLHDTMIYQKTSSSLPDKTRYSQVFEFMFIFVKDKLETFHPIVDKLNKQAGSRNPTKKRSTNGEMIKTQKYYTIPEVGKRTNIWTYEVGYNKGTKDIIAFEHPATFPEKLVEDHIISWSNPEDLVLDPFMGSGTTAKIAKKLSRNYIGFEISKEYCSIAEKRLERNSIINGIK